MPFMRHMRQLGTPVAKSYMLALQSIAMNRQRTVKNFRAGPPVTPGSNKRCDG